jgi:uncharacterized protein (DUF58 family)
MSTRTETLHREALALPFVALVAVLLLGATQYANNLGFFFAFWLMALAVGGFIGLRRQLLNVQVCVLHIDACFANETATLQLEIQNAGGMWLTFGLKERHNDHVALSTILIERNPQNAIQTTSQNINLQLPHRPRGVYSGEPLQLSTRDPLGLMRMQRQIHLGSKYWVFPTPHGERPLPQGEQPTHAQGQDDFHGLRNYQAGDSPARIHWQSLAKSTPHQPNLRVKQFGSDTSPLPAPRLLDESQLLDLALETRLSQLAAWILHCEHQGEAYVLRMRSGKITAPGLGTTQRQNCLRILAEAT